MNPKRLNIIVVAISFKTMAQSRNLSRLDSHCCIDRVIETRLLTPSLCKTGNFFWSSIVIHLIYSWQMWVRCVPVFFFFYFFWGGGCEGVVFHTFIIMMFTNLRLDNPYHIWSVVFNVLALDCWINI